MSFYVFANIELEENRKEKCTFPNHPIPPPPPSLDRSFGQFQ